MPPLPPLFLPHQCSGPNGVLLFHRLLNELDRWRAGLTFALSFLRARERKRGLGESAVEWKEGRQFYFSRSPLTSFQEV